LRSGLEIISDCILHPAFSDEELEKEKRQVMEEIRSQQDNVSSEAFRLFSQTLFKLFRKHGLDEGLPEPEPFDAATLESVDLARFGAAIFTTGFRPDYASWLPWREAFDPQGFPLHDDGASTAVPGLFFLGTHFLRKRKSSLLIGVGEDAAIVAERVAAAG